MSMCWCRDGVCLCDGVGTVCVCDGVGTVCVCVMV